MSLLLQPVLCFLQRIVIICPITIIGQQLHAMCVLEVASSSWLVFCLLELDVRVQSVCCVYLLLLFSSDHTKSHFTRHFSIFNGEGRHRRTQALSVLVEGHSGLYVR